MLQLIYFVIKTLTACNLAIFQYATPKLIHLSPKICLLSKPYFLKKIYFNKKKPVQQRISGETNSYPPPTTIKNMVLCVA